MSTSSKEYAAWQNDNAFRVSSWIAELLDDWSVSKKAKEALDFMPENFSLVELAAARDNLAFDDAGLSFSFRFPRLPSRRFVGYGT